MQSRNLPITLKTVSDIEAVMGENVPEKINSLLTKLSSGNLGQTKIPTSFSDRRSSSNNFVSKFLFMIFRSCFYLHARPDCLEKNVI